MQNEIELKLGLYPEQKSIIIDFLARQPILAQGQLQLVNTYYDTADQSFARHKMGLRVRSQNHHHELTLKLAGSTLGGLHIRPEYHLALADREPDFKRLVSHYNLQFDKASGLHQPLLPQFNTDFQREYWLIAHHHAEIEVALDYGSIKNPHTEQLICELEFELKQGEPSQLLDFLALMPKVDGIWLSSLSKAERGYLLGNSAELAKKVAKLTACQTEHLTPLAHFQLTQQLADLIRFTKDERLIQQYEQLTHTPLHHIDRLSRAEYLAENLALLRHHLKDRQVTP